MLVKGFAASGFLPLKTFSVPRGFSDLFNNRLTRSVSFYFNLILYEIIFPFHLLSLFRLLLYFFCNSLSSLFGLIFRKGNASVAKTQRKTCDHYYSPTRKSPDQHAHNVDSFGAPHCAKNAPREFVKPRCPGGMRS